MTNKISQEEMLIAHFKVDGNYSDADYAESALAWFNEQDISFSVHSHLHEAWRNCKTNAECAELLRLYLTDGAKFSKKHMPKV